VSAAGAPGASRGRAGRATSALAGRTWPEVAAGARAVLALPLGSTEQHGPHLPLDTDTRVAVALAERLAGRRPDVLVAPALPYGSSGEHAGFPGTVSIGRAALELVLVELVRSLGPEFRATVLVVGHGGNAAPVAAARELLEREGRKLVAWFAAPMGGDAHAGRTETSLLLALDPAAVRLDRAVAGTTRPVEELMPALASAGVRAVSANGVLGDPAGASAAEGRQLLAALTGDLCRAVEAGLGPTAATWARPGDGAGAPGPVGAAPGSGAGAGGTG
jgi:mycofactocin precursor peptide peptidase